MWPLLLYKAVVTVKDAFGCKTWVQRGYKMSQVTFDLVFKAVKNKIGLLSHVIKENASNFFQRCCVIVSSKMGELHYKTSVRTKEKSYHTNFRG